MSRMRSSSSVPPVEDPGSRIVGQEYSIPYISKNPRAKEGLYQIAVLQVFKALRGVARPGPQNTFGTAGHLVLTEASVRRIFDMTTAE